MLWFFDRQQESMTLETRFDNDTSEYVVIVRRANQDEQTERFRDPESCRLWLKAFEDELELQHWKTRGAPAILPDGWPKAYRSRPN